MTAPLDGSDYRWEEHYLAGDTPWDLDGPPPVLASVLARFADRPRDVLVPGCGYGHDAIAWAAAGHRVTAVDIAPSALAGARARAAEAGVALELLEADVLALPASRPHAFDVAWEHTCFCALDPGQRRAYGAAIAGLLRPGGVLVALLWNHGVEGGPPWDVSEAAARDALEPAFAFTAVEPVAVSAERHQDEFLATLTPR
jgi:SAM-dependent methyltransferase